MTKPARHKRPALSAPSRASLSRRWKVAAALGLIVVVGLLAGWRFGAAKRVASLDTDRAGFARLSAAAPTFTATVENGTNAPGLAPAGMVWIPGGEFSMGSTIETESICGLPGVTRDALPVHRVYVDGFWMDATEVTNEQFEKFIQATGYVTIAERTPTREEFPTAPPENLVAGSTVFTATPGPVPLNDFFQWWRYEHGANWRHPEGPGTDARGREKFPVVHIAYDDAVAYAKWAGKRLPTEAEFEFAARGGQTGWIYAWGDELHPGGKFMANTYQGQFPVKDEGADGFAGMAPVAQFPPNAYGLYDISGNVWEWCNDWYRPDYYAELERAGHVARNPTGPATGFDPAEPDEKKRVHRGGSYLCTDQYCTRYMVGTRGKGEASTGSNHLGFRCVKTAASMTSHKTN
jgi:formylglycine-generating enzyme required for sulfatase activity